MCGQTFEAAQWPSALTQGATTCLQKWTLGARDLRARVWVCVCANHTCVGRSSLVGRLVTTPVCWGLVNMLLLYMWSDII